MSTEVLSRPDRLSELEEQIYRGFASFCEAGRALDEIRQEKLYQETGHKTFDDYCQVRWGIKRGRAYQLIEASQVYQNLSTTVDKNELPTSERQLRPLVKLEAEEQVIVWQQTVEKEGPRPTGPQVEQVAQDFRPAPKPGKMPPPRTARTTSTPANVGGSGWGEGPGIEAEFERADQMTEYRELLERAGYFVAGPDELAGDKCPCCGRSY